MACRWNRVGNLLAVAEQLVLLLTSADGGAAKLQTQVVSCEPQTLILQPNCHSRRELFPYLGDQDAVTLLDAHGQAVALLVEGTGADGEDLGLVELLDARLGQEDAAGGLGLGLDALDQDAVEERGEGADGANRSGLCPGAPGRSVMRPIFVILPAFRCP